MKFIDVDSYEMMSRVGADVVRRCVEQKPNALLCIATGGTPKQMYKRVAEDIQKQELSADQLRIVALDEWHGLPADAPGTCGGYIREHVSGPWNIPDERFIRFDPETENPEEECRRVTAELQKIGPIDLCILGLGRNGHLGLNEPGNTLAASTHTAKLDELSQAHPMLVNSGSRITQGMTLGLSEIMQSKEILMLITGSDKAEAFQTLKKQRVSTQCPASFLWLHPNVTCFVDKEM